MDTFCLLASILPQFVDEAFVGLVLVILSIVGLVGGSFIGFGITFNAKTPQGIVTYFLIGIGACGILIIFADVLNQNG